MPYALILIGLSIMIFTSITYMLLTKRVSLVTAALAAAIAGIMLSEGVHEWASANNKTCFSFP